MLRAPPIPVQPNDSLSREEGGSWADESDGYRGWVVDQQGDGLAPFNDLDMTWGLDLDLFIQELEQQAPALSEDGDGIADAIDSSQRSAFDPSSAPMARADKAE